MASVGLDQLVETLMCFITCVQMLGIMCHSVLYLTTYCVKGAVFQVVSVSWF